MAVSPVMEFHASASDTSLSVKKDDSDIIILLLYVDDIILTGSNPLKIQKDMGQLTYFLGIQVQYKADGNVFVNQSKYIKDLVHKAAAYLNTCWLITSYVVYFGNNPISWQSKKQNSVSRSATETEYKALAHTAADIAWFRNILKDLGVFLDAPPTIHCKNMSVIALSANINWQKSYTKKKSIRSAILKKSCVTPMRSAMFVSMKDMGN
ncbi:unnamed protein product [Malus baccata var. baccata]